MQLQMASIGPNTIFYIGARKLSIFPFCRNSMLGVTPAFDSPPTDINSRGSYWYQHPLHRPK